MVTSASQLGAGILGMGLAVRRRHAYHWLSLRGRPDRVAADALTMGTGLSAPSPMLLVQLAAIILLARRRHERFAVIALGALGAIMVPGYLGERVVRLRLRAAGWDRTESPVVLVGVILAAAMPVFAVRALDAEPQHA